ncbi:MAG: hypothetical protein F8N38_06410 [Hungatella sp.]|nr:hypothetical protein [Hungatella sp.]
MEAQVRIVTILCNFYGRERGYIHHIISEASFKTKGRIANELKELIKDVIIEFIKNIESGK